MLIDLTAEFRVASVKHYFETKIIEDTRKYRCTPNRKKAEISKTNIILANLYRDPGKAAVTKSKVANQQTILHN